MATQILSLAASFLIEYAQGAVISLVGKSIGDIGAFFCGQLVDALPSSNRRQLITN
jgi:hypothetical protein